MKGYIVLDSDYPNGKYGTDKDEPEQLDSFGMTGVWGWLEILIIFIALFTFKLSINAQITYSNYLLSNLEDCVLKLSKHSQEFFKMSRILTENGQEYEACHTERLAYTASGCGEAISHICDLIRIYNISNEKNVKSFIMDKVEFLTSPGMMVYYKTSIDYLDALIKHRKKESDLEKIKELRNDLIFAVSILEKL